MDKSLTDVYYNKIINSSNKALDMFLFYRALFEREDDISANATDIKMFSELIRLFGVNRVFISLMHIYLYYDNVPHRHIKNSLHKDIEYNLKQEFGVRDNVIDVASNDVLKEERDKLYNKKKFIFREIK